MRTAGAPEGEAVGRGESGTGWVLDDAGAATLAAARDRGGAADLGLGPVRSGRRLDGPGFIAAGPAGDGARPAGGGEESAGRLGGAPGRTGRRGRLLAGDLRISRRPARGRAPCLRPGARG